MKIEIGFIICTKTFDHYVMVILEKAYEEIFLVLKISHSQCDVSEADSA